MAEHDTELREAGAAYKRARIEADQIMAGPREGLTEAVREAYRAGMRKADILRAIEHTWSRQWIDDTLRDIEPPGGKHKRKPSG